MNTDPDYDNHSCNRCKAANLSSWTTIYTGDHKVQEVICKACRNDDTLREWDQDHRLHSHATLEAALKTYRWRNDPPNKFVDLRWTAINEASNRVHDYVKANFEPSVWFGHGGHPFTKTEDKWGSPTCGFGTAVCEPMAKVIRASKASWMVSKETDRASRLFSVLPRLHDYTLKTWCTAGRCLIELENPKARITLITAENEDAMRMGIQGIDATEMQAIGLLDWAEKAWTEGAITLVDKVPTP